jgi:uncharacterized protein YecE (DUF72 family)
MRDGTRGRTLSWSGRRRSALAARTYGRPHAPARDVLVGTSGFRTSRTEYVATFPLLEVRATFDEPPEPQVARRWRTQSPEDFEYAVCAWRLITHPLDRAAARHLKRTGIGDRRRSAFGHFQPTDEVLEAWEATDAVARALDAMAVVFETPASFTPDDTNRRHMEEFFAPLRLPGREAPHYCWEARGEAWSDALFGQWCAELGLVPAYDPFARDTAAVEGACSPPLRYFRVRGATGFRHRFAPDELDRLWEHCGLKPTVCVFRNVEAFEDARSFLELVERRAGAFGVMTAR